VIPGGDGTLLRVDLAARTSRVEPLPAAARRRDAGGGLLGTRLLLAEVPPRLDAFAPEQLLTLASGIAAGHRTVGLPSFSVVAKSPLSGGIGEARVQGPFGPALRDASHDAIVLAGAACSPAYLLVGESGAEVRDAADLWGLDTAAATDRLRARHGAAAHVAAIGVAGERRVRYASIVSDYGFSADRLGLGAVMGAKRLKAVVLTGAPARHAADPAAAEGIAEDYRRAIPGNRLTASQHDPPGFGAWIGPGLEGYLGVENFRTSDAGDLAAFGPGRFRARLAASEDGCPGCPQHCLKRFHSGTADPRAGVLHQEAVAAFAAHLGLRDLDAVLELNARCRLWGLDPVSLAFTLALVCELRAEGRLSPGALGEPLPRFGDAEAVLAVADAVAHRRGAGDLLAEGAARTAARLGPEAARYAMHSKGVEATVFDPRGSHGLALAHAVSPLGPRYDLVEHDIDFDPVRGDPRFIARAVEFGGRPDGTPMAMLDAAKVRFVARLLELWSGYDAVGLCLFAAAPTRELSTAAAAALVTAVSGFEASAADIVAWGRRRLALMREYNRREGIGADADTLPERFFAEALDAGALAGAALDRDAFEQGRALLYAELGWDAA
jgi:aldehyde:ferredoxin oxidoreductase